jgi:hypothetical protein
MAWSNSKIFRPFLGDALANTAAFDLSGSGVDTFKVALYPTGVTPNQDVTAANSAYGAGVWTGEVIDTTGGTSWPTGGRPLVTPAIDVSVANTVFWDAADTASADSTADIAAVFGCLVYDDTLTTPVADQGVCYNYFGGTQTVTNGTFTIVWHANGIFRFTI